MLECIHVYTWVMYYGHLIKAGEKMEIKFNSLVIEMNVLEKH